MSKLMKVSFRLLDLMVVFTMIFGLPMSALAAPAEQPAAITIPSNFFTVVDIGGPNDEVSQADMTQMGRDDSDPTEYKLFWSWDATDDWTGTGQTGDACALFDSDGDGNINQAVCVRINNPGANPNLVNQVVGATDGNSPFVWNCSDAKPDRCTNPSGPLPYTSTQVQSGAIGTMNASPPANLITDTDPFPNLNSDQNWPNDSTIEIHILKSYLMPGATLVNVCSFPSAGNGGNNDPKDCIVTPGGGYLKIDKAAGSDTTTQFNFTVNPGALSKSVTGTGTTGAFPMPVGTAYSVAETLVTGWDLTNAVCKLEDGTTVTGTKSGSTISGITVQSGKITTCTFTNVKQVPQLTLTKTASPATYSAVGQTISYSYLVKNTGNVSFAGPVTVTDDKATVTCPAGGLAPNATTTCTASYTITQADLDNGSVKNTATAHANGTNSNTDDETVTAVKSPALSLTKSASPSTYDTVGQAITYSYTIKNTGNVTLSGPFTVSDNKATVTCTQPADGALSPNETMTCSATYTVTQADLDASSITNTATATNGTVTSNQATATVYAVAHPNLSLVKTATPATYSKVGDVVSYSYEVKNIGNVALKPPYAVTDDKATVTCPQTPDPLPVGSSITCTASYSITQADLDAGSVTNIATATATFGGNAVTSNQAQATVNAVQTRALTLDKTAQETTYAKAGDLIHYSYLVTNSGNVTLHDAITVSDNKTTATCPALPAGGLIPGASITCSATYAVTQADLDAGSVTNVASATSGTTTSNTDTVTVQATQSPALSLTKSASPATYTSAGQTISYSYDLKNTGNVTLSGPFAVTDDKATVTCPSVTSLAVGDTLTCTASHTVTQVEVDDGSITNHATATATFGGNTVTSNEATATVTATQNPVLSLAKTASPSTYDTAGQSISYSYVLKNTGNVTLSGPFTVSDDKATVTCPADATLAVGASITCSASYVITQADMDAGSVTNTATGHASFGGNAVDSNPDSETVNALQQGGLGLTKSAEPVTYSTVGTEITYTYIVKNTGNVTLAGPFTVNDDKVGAVSCPAGSLAPTDTVTCTATYTIQQSDLDAGFVTNIATATDGTLTSNEAQATVNAEQKPALALDKTAQETTYATAGDVIHYSYLVTNAGNVTLHDPITVNDDKATDEACPALPAGGLAPGASITCTASYIIQQSDLDAGALTNVASATDGKVTSPTDTVTIPATQSPALTLKKSANPLTYTTDGQTITYDYLLTNSGNVTLSAPFAVTDDKAPVDCPAAVTSLAPGATLNCTATYTITQADLDSGSVTNVATATAKFGATTVTSNQDTATVNALQSPALSLVKSASPSTYDAAGQTISYSYVLTNSGNVTLAGPFTVSDDKTTVTCPADATLAVGASITCNATYTIMQADLDAGFVTNTATGHASFGGNAVDSNPDSETINAIPMPALSLVKTADPVTYDTVGQSISYSYVLKNIGNVTLAGPFTVSDDKAAVTCPADATLAVDAEITCSATYAITQADLDAGFVTNLATGHAQTLGGTPVNSNNASATVNAEKKPALAILKTAQEATYAAVGDVIHYSYLVTNSGNVTLHDAIVVSDDKATDESCPALPAGGLAPGDSITCTASYKITQVDLDAGSVTNIASAASGTTVSPTDTETVNAIPMPALTIDKSAVESTYSKAGDLIHYSYLVTNTGNVTLFNITVTDDKATVTCPDTSAGLAPLATITCSATYMVSQADLDAGSVINSAYAKSGDTQSPPDTVTVPATQTPALTIDKTATPSTYSAVGDVIHYSYVVTNTGNVTLFNITVTDDKASVTCPDTSAGLAPLGTITCTASYTISQADLDFGSLTNSAYAKSGDSQSPPDTVTVPATQTPALSLTKEATPHFSDPVKVGDTIDYTLTATNTGNITLTNVSISDALLPSLTCTPDQPATLAPAATLVCTGTYAITQADINAGKVNNTGIADSDQTPPTDTPHEEQIPQAPHLTLTKSGALDMTVVDPSNRADVGDVINYTLTATNDGNVTLTNVSISDPLLGTLSCMPSQPATLAPTEQLVCTGTYTLELKDLNAGNVHNIATGDSDQTPPTDTPNDVPVPPAPHLSLTKVGTLDMTVVAPSDRADVGDVINYTLTAINDGNVTLTNVSITDALLGTLSCNPDQPATLDPGASLVCTGSYTLTQPDLDAGNVHNVATGSSQQTPPTDTPNDVPVPGAPAIQLTKSATLQLGDNGTLEAGDTVQYGFVIQNTGNVTLTGVDLSDSLLGYINATCGSTNLAPGESTNCNATYTILQSDLDAGSVANTGNACGTPPTGADVCDTDSTSTPLAQNPALTLNKTASPSTYDAAGQTISYSYLVTNSGNVTLFGSITVTDDKSTVSCPALDIAGLKPGASITCNATYTILQSDLDSGSVTNTAYATGSFKGNEVKSNTDAETVTAVQKPAIDLVKTVTSAGPYDSVGDLIEYKLVATNTGNVTLTNVSISDPLLGTLTCTQPVDLAPGDALTCTGSYAIQQGDLNAGKVDNTATATGSFGGKDYTDTDSQSVTMTQSPAISLTKSAAPLTYDAMDQTITYSYVITNTGNVTLPGPFTVSDDKATVTCDAAPVGGLAPLATLNCSATYKITQADLDAGSVKNTATASTTYDNKNVTSGPADATVTADQKPAVSLTKTASPLTYNAVNQTITYSYVIKNTGNVTLSGPFTITDNKATVACTQPADGKLSPDETMNCTATYKTTQADLDAGSVTNKATATNGTVTSNEATATVTAVQTPAITLTKTPDKTTYSKAGDVITYTLVAKNTGNVTLHDVSISDPKLGTLTCTQPVTLAPGATLTCTGTYTIQAADLTVFSVTNTATVNAKSPKDEPVTATATATVYRQTGALLPTQTTCQQYAAGPSAWPPMYDAFTYQVKSGKINSVAPGVIFYYNTITAPAASFTLTVVETNSLSWKPMFIQDLGQAILYTANCSKASGVTVTAAYNSSTKKYTVTFNVTGATPGAIYYIGIKYSPQNLVGQAVKSPYPTSNYSWTSSLNNVALTGSTASIPVKYKK